MTGALQDFQKRLCVVFDSKCWYLCRPSSSKIVGGRPEPQLPSGLITSVKMLAILSTWSAHILPSTLLPAAWASSLAGSRPADYPLSQCDPSLPPLQTFFLCLCHHPPASTCSAPARFPLLQEQLLFPTSSTLSAGKCSGPLCSPASCGPLSRPHDHQGS